MHHQEDVDKRRTPQRAGRRDDLGVLLGREVAEERIRRAARLPLRIQHPSLKRSSGRERSGGPLETWRESTVVSTTGAAVSVTRVRRQQAVLKGANLSGVAERFIQNR